MRLLFDWIKTGFRNATREGIQLGVADAVTAVSGGQVEFTEPARIEAPADDTPQETTAAATTKTKTTSRKRSK